MSIKFGKLVKALDNILPLPLFVKKMHIRRKTRDELHKYWTFPNDNINIPSEYLKRRERSIFLLNLIKKYIENSNSVLEIGCNVGRNLNELFCAGFSNLSGLEISKNAIDLMEKAYPLMAQRIKIYHGPVENLILDFQDNCFDLVFTMAALQHIHTDSEFIFAHIARITKKILVTIEDEQGLSSRHFPRNYNKVFENLGMKQIEEIFLCKENSSGLDSNFLARVFKK